MVGQVGLEQPGMVGLVGLEQFAFPRSLAILRELQVGTWCSLGSFMV